MVHRFENRTHAGQLLADELTAFANRPDVMVLGLPRGGVPVAYEVAKRLNAPLDVFLVRKLGVPGHEEYAMGAMASGGVTLLNEDVVAQLGISDRDISRVIEREREELHRRETAYGRFESSVDVHARTVILIDDGLATGSTMKVAVQAVREHDPRIIIVAVPVAPLSAKADFRRIADEFICVLAPEVFHAVGEWYEDFAQTTDAEVRQLLQQATREYREKPSYL